MSSAERLNPILSLFDTNFLGKKLENESHESRALDLKTLTSAQTMLTTERYPCPKWQRRNWVGLHLVTHRLAHLVLKNSDQCRSFVFLTSQLRRIFARYLGRNSSRADRSNEPRPAIGNPYVQVDCRGDQEFPGDRHRARRHQGGLVSGIGS